MPNAAQAPARAHAPSGNPQGSYGWLLREVLLLIMLLGALLVLPSTQVDRFFCGKVWWA
jgi:hypothetical protein